MRGSLPLSMLLVSLLVSGGLALAATHDVTGKVAGVFHEKVSVPIGNGKTAWRDKVSVALRSCDANGAPSSTLALAHYAPGNLSDDNALASLFRANSQAARGSVIKNQFMSMVSGYATFTVDEAGVIHKSTFWGHNWECGKALAAAQPIGGLAAPGGNTAPQYQQPQQPANPLTPGGMLRRFSPF